MGKRESKRRRIGYLLLVLFLVYVVSLWVLPSSWAEPKLAVELLPGKVPTYEVSVQNLTPWPVTLTDATWLVTHNGIYEYWAPSEPPKQKPLLFPLQEYTFRFTIYNQTDTEALNYYSGPLVVELRAMSQVLWVSTTVRIQSWYNSTSS